VFVVEEVGSLQGNRNIDSSISCSSQAYSHFSPSTATAESATNILIWVAAITGRRCL